LAGIRGKTEAAAHASASAYPRGTADAKLSVTQYV